MANSRRGTPEPAVAALEGVVVMEVGRYSHTCPTKGEPAVITSTHPNRHPAVVFMMLIRSGLV